MKDAEKCRKEKKQMHSEYSFNHESIKGKLSINNPGDQDEYHNFNDLTICVAQIGRGVIV